MRIAALNLHYNSLIVLVADDNALQNAFRHANSSLCLAFGRLLAGNSLNTRNVAANLLHARGFLKLASRFLKAQIKLFFLQCDQLFIDLSEAFCPNISGFHGCLSYSAMRWIKRVLTGNFAAPSLSASRATSSGTPSSSNITRPGATRHAQ